MDARKLNKVFAEIKESAKLDYAYTNVDNLGDCNSCVNAALCDVHGVESHGIYVKHWRKGMNASGAMLHQDKLYIAHDLTQEQGDRVLLILGKYYKVENLEYNPSQSFCISEK